MMMTLLLMVVMIELFRISLVLFIAHFRAGFRDGARLTTGWSSTCSSQTTQRGRYEIIDDDNDDDDDDDCDGISSCASSLTCVSI